MWKFYTYALVDGDQVVYVGKGSGGRLAQQRDRHQCNGHELARFKRERDAYAHEVAAIAEHAPVRNMNRGGGGSKAQPVREPRLPASVRRWYEELERVGSRRWVARYLLSLDPRQVPAESKLESFGPGLRRVAYGPRC